MESGLRPLLGEGSWGGEFHPNILDSSDVGMSAAGVKPPTKHPHMIGRGGVGIAVVENKTKQQGLVRGVK